MAAKTADGARSGLAFEWTDDDGDRAPSSAPLGEGTRQPGDDFFCRRFAVWYRSYDCAVRTRFETCPACLRCEQGRFNLHRHRAALGNRSLLRAYRG